MAWVGLWLMVLVGGFRWLMLFSEWACGIPPIRLPTPGNWIVVFVTLCLTNAPQALLFIHHLPPSYPFFPQVTAHVTHLQCSAKCQLLCSPSPSFKWVAYGWPQSALRMRKTKPVTACLFFYLANSTPHLLSHTKLLPSNKRHTYTPLLPHLPCHTHSWTTFLHPYPPYSPTPHTHKHTWPTSFPVRHESDGWSAFTGVIHGY